MRRINLFIISIFLLCFISGNSQSADPWIKFENKKTELVGYKDQKGQIKIPAKYAAVSPADTFYNIMFVVEEFEDSSVAYYLLKDGRKIGRDSVYVSEDNYFDCENEGKIRFELRQKNRMGFFDKNGKVIIPPVYNYVTPFRNNMSMAIMDAEKKCLSPGDTMNCEKYFWEGGKGVVINDKNEILIDSFPYALTNLNWYSVKINEKNIDTNVYVSLKGTDGRIYSLIDYEKEFSKWFYKEFIKNVEEKNIPNLSKMCYEKINLEGLNLKNTEIEKGVFLNKYFDSILNKRFGVNKSRKGKIWFSNNYWFSQKKSFERYYDACNSFRSDKFPVFEVILENNINDQHEYQESFLFLRNSDGYKLIEVGVEGE